ncbi:uncharacterized protein LOC108098204 [Drosophila ficusphila]|uniref:uncharacterized protein LOC108098204 n=1 Tax=Drosophila ficusphila TaxID=30025 RepID=UPI001C88E51C|nr:uncharacterized protein LOC108098204 [Drosophila ficusphila]
MNNCCCRSHSDRTDPLACIQGIPRLHRVQSCRPYLEGRKAMSCCVSRERRWGQRNLGMIQLLAKMVDKSASTVCQFLHQLTLQLFAKILYPLMMGWNTLKIPFVLPDTCELYYGIFDECGNLRKPIPTRTLLILITMMQYFLNLPKRGCKRSEQCPGCKSAASVLSSIHNPGYCGKDAMTPFSMSKPTAKVSSPGSEVRAGLRRLGYERPGDLEMYPSDESIPYGYAPNRCHCQAGNRELYRAQRSKGIKNPYADLPEHLRPLACEHELRSSLLASDFNPRCPAKHLSPEVAQLMQIASISNLYAAVVQNQHSRMLFAEGRPPIPKVIPCTENSRRFSGGFMMPEPYFNGMPWSWLHRDPQKMVRLPSGGLPPEIPRYRSLPMDEEYHSFKSSYENSSSLLPYKRAQDRFLPAIRETKMLDYEKPLNSVDNEKKREWEDILLKKVNEARRTQTPLDYWKEMMKRNLSRRTFDHGENDSLSLRRITTPMTEKKSIIFLRSAKQIKSTVLENRKEKTEQLPSIIKTYRKHNDWNDISPKNRTNPQIIVQENSDPKDLFNRQIGNKSAVKIAKTENVKQDYLDPEHYRREVAREHSRKRRYERKVAGESVLLIRPVENLQPEGGDQIPKHQSEPHKKEPRFVKLSNRNEGKKCYSHSELKSPKTIIKKMSSHSVSFKDRSDFLRRFKHSGIKSPKIITKKLSSHSVFFKLKSEFLNRFKMPSPKEKVQAEDF